MASIELKNVQSALAEWMDSRVMTAMDNASPNRWLIGGVSTIAISNLHKIIKTHSVMLRSLGLLDESDCIVFSVVESFITNAFNKQSLVKMPLLGIPFTFNADDGQALIDCLKRHGGI